MTIPHALLALLAEGPKIGLRLKQEFEARTGVVWPLNVGQVYTTLSRLRRDGLVEASQDESGRPSGNLYRITGTGWSALREWLSAPSQNRAPHRDEVVIKVMVALSVAGRRSCESRPGPSPRGDRGHAAVHAVQGCWRRDLALALVADAQLFRLEATVRWLDSCEARLSARRPPRDPRSAIGCSRPDEDRERAVTTMRPAAELLEVSKVYDDGGSELQALDGVSLCVAPSEMVAVMGPSGSGKSTLLEIVGGLSDLTSGEVWVDGRNLSAMGRDERARMRRSAIGYVFQELNLLGALHCVRECRPPR